MRARFLLSMHFFCVFSRLNRASLLFSSNSRQIWATISRPNLWRTFSIDRCLPEAGSYILFPDDSVLLFSFFFFFFFFFSYFNFLNSRISLPGEYLGMFFFSPLSRFFFPWFHHFSLLNPLFLYHLSGFSPISDYMRNSPSRDRKTHLPGPAGSITVSPINFCPIGRNFVSPRAFQEKLFLLLEVSLPSCLPFPSFTEGRRSNDPTYLVFFPPFLVHCSSRCDDRATFYGVRVFFLYFLSRFSRPLRSIAPPRRSDNFARLRPFVLAR